MPPTRYKYPAITFVQKSNTTGWECNLRWTRWWCLGSLQLMYKYLLTCYCQSYSTTIFIVCWWCSLKFYRPTLQHIRHVTCGRSCRVQNNVWTELLNCKYVCESLQIPQPPSYIALRWQDETIGQEEINKDRSWRNSSRCLHASNFLKVKYWGGPPHNTTIEYQFQEDPNISSSFKPLNIL